MFALGKGKGAESVRRINKITGSVKQGNITVLYSKSKDNTFS